MASAGLTLDHGLMVAVGRSLSPYDNSMGRTLDIQAIKEDGMSGHSQDMTTTTTRPLATPCGRERNPRSPNGFRLITLTPIRWWHEARFEAHMRRAQRDIRVSLRAEQKLRLTRSRVFHERAAARVDRAIKHGHRAEAIKTGTPIGG